MARDDRRIIVGFMGLAGAGKDTAAEAMRLAAQAQGMAHYRASFADPIRDVGRDVFGLTYPQMTDRALKEEVLPEWGLSPRQILQRIGTEMGRNIHEDVWIRALESRIRHWVGLITIPDVRFPNEARAIKEMGGHLVLVDRTEGPIVADSHPSEQMAANIRRGNYPEGVASGDVERLLNTSCTRFEAQLRAVAIFNGWASGD